MDLDDVLLESLLHREEGPDLDFKQNQYRYFNVSSSDEKANRKSELVKDILAIANASRESTGYILIGVEEVRGGRSNIIGIQEQLNDADLHTLINSKTQRPVEFSYAPYTYRGLYIGVIAIPAQDRFLYLTHDYGKLHANVVYIRDGSSTRIATPDEVVAMSAPKRPELVLAWADSETSLAYPSPYTMKSLLLYPPLPEDTFKLPSPPVQRLYGLEIPTPSYSRPNPDYSLELIVYTCFRAFFMPLGLQLHNESGVAATRVRFEGTMKKQNGLAVQAVLPSFPKKDTNLYSELSNMGISPLSRVHEARMELQEDSERWKISVEFGDIRPDEKISTKDTLWFGSGNSETVSLKGKLLGENISEPIQCSLDIRIETECRPMTEEDVDLCRRAHFESLGVDAE